jgi:PadR family transcriptional regulator, regulatory protein AphA
LQEIRLTPISFIVLGLLSWAEQATPYELKQMAAPLSDLWSVQHTQLYGEPARLAKAGYLSERQEATGRRRKTYRLTRKGREALAEWLTGPTSAFTELRDPGLLKLYFGADPQAVAAEQAELHRRKLAEYETFVAHGSPDEAEGPWLALQAGLAHEREWVRYWEKLKKLEIGSR